MLGQSLAFYQDEFAGRVAAKVMQTALAVRDTTFILTDILVFVTPDEATSPGVQPGVERSSRNGLLLLDVLAQDFDWCATTRRGEVGRRPQDAPALQPRMEVSEFLAQQAR
jgi:hypothetical protein